MEPIRYVPPFPAAIPGAWTMEIGIYRGYWMVEWFKREFGDREVARAADARASSPRSCSTTSSARSRPGRWA